MVVIEQYPRLGNTLFLIAAAEALARENNDEVALPSWKYAHVFDYHLKCGNGLFTYNQPEFKYSPIPYSPGLKLTGYFQSEKFFDKHSDYIRKIFTPADSYRIPIQDKCAIHVRRGDYLDLQDHHPVLPLAYYQKAINEVQLKNNDEVEFIVFSDDPTWCQEHFDSDIQISWGNEIEDFCYMAACTKHIIANSSFSWWAAWLANGEVYAPNHNKWFGPAYHYHDTSDLIPERWTQIDF